MEIIYKELHTDVLIIGGGTAGCYAALTLAEEKGLGIVIAEKANIKRSGCLAAGVNALNAYIVEGNTPRDYLEYVKKDAHGIIREDLVLTMSEQLNEVTRRLEDIGLVILKDEKGNYVARGNRNIKINGENIKPLLAKAVAEKENVTVLNNVNIAEYLLEEDRVIGAMGFDITGNTFYTIYAKGVICATGGAAGIYKPNNTGLSRHKMWYPPFNTGAGYAMGIRSGAEMTSFEMRFIALRCKDTIAPTGTIAQGLGGQGRNTPQINALGREYEKDYGDYTTSGRVYSTVEENRQGRGPCFLRTKGISEREEQELFKAYLNMAPAQTLRWLEGEGGPSGENVEICGTEPYIVGGHTASGYWVDTGRRTTLKGLYAAGDVAGGCPQKYVTGSLAEGKIAALSFLEDRKDLEVLHNRSSNEDKRKNKILRYLEESRNRFLYSTSELEEAMQKVMDEYAGGISVNYGYNETKLSFAEGQIKTIRKLAEDLRAEDFYGLMKICELLDRLDVALTLIAHLRARKETRWHAFQENLDYPEKREEFFLYINSVKKGDVIEVIKRELVKEGEVYEHKNQF